MVRGILERWVEHRLVVTGRRLVPDADTAEKPQIKPAVHLRLGCRGQPDHHITAGYAARREAAQAAATASRMACHT